MSKNITRISPADAKKLIDEQGYTYVDVRTEAEYAAGHPKGAQNVPVMNAGARGMEPNPDFLKVAQAAYPKDAKLVLGCRSGVRSMRAAQMLVDAGFTSIVEQRAGWEGARNAFGAVTEPGWSPAGLPTETTTPGGSYAELKQRK
jgi:rhodanese-related sulfurtransferase